VQQRRFNLLRSEKSISTRHGLKFQDETIRVSISYGVRSPFRRQKGARRLTVLVFQSPTE